MESDVRPEVNTSNPETCTENNCLINPDYDDNKTTLLCKICKRKVHHKCSLLPPYQLQRYITFRERFNPYICSNCIQVPENIRNSQSQHLFDTVEKFNEHEIKEELEVLKETIRNKDAEIEQLKERLCKLEDKDKTTQQKQKKRKINEDEVIVEESTSKQSENSILKDKDLAMKEKQISLLAQENEALNARLTEREQALDETLKQLADADTPVVGIDKVEKIINDKMTTMQTKLFEMINKKLDDKAIHNNNTTTVSYAAATNGKKIGFQEPRKQQMKPMIENFRTIMMATKNEELAEIRDKKERSKNLIIHGREESEDNQADTAFVQKFIQAVGSSYIPKTLMRIGRTENRKRPIKVVLQSNEERDNLLNNLRNLKGNNDFKGISITEDYTIAEREIIKEYNRDAKEKNAAEPENSNYIWRVRGTPKNGLIIKRFTKVMPQPDHNQQ